MKHPLRTVALAALLPAVLHGAARAEDRPRIQVAFGLGASLDRNAPNPTPDAPIPAFFFLGGFGGGPFGVDLRLFANGAKTVQITRTAAELALVLRPLSYLLPSEPGYARRVLRSAALDLGPVYERVNLGMRATGRVGALLGAHVDLPLGPVAAKELRLRLGARRMWGPSVTVGDITVEDSLLEIYGMMAVVF